MKHTGGSDSRFDFFTGAGYHRYQSEVNQVAKKVTCPKCGDKTSFGSKTMFGLCCACFLAESKKCHLMDAASWTPPGEEGVLWKPQSKEDLTSTKPGPVERDLFKMTVEDVILDFGCRVWEAV